MLKDEQDRITTQERAAKYELDVAESDLDGWQDVLRTAIKLAGNCHAAYLKARPSVRRRFNQAVLEAVSVKDRRIAQAELSDVFAPLFSRPSSNTALKVVDIGCGTGLTTREAARAAAPGHVVGVDVSERMLERACQVTAAERLDNVRYELGDAQVHPFDAAGFDVAISRFGTKNFLRSGRRVRQHRRRPSTRGAPGAARLAATRAQRMGAGDRRRAG
ncbi:MAG: class I SAM-dependent methyltransferase [Solirubrobacteraceae bacterium MAG38_C4-C5]|nr:class I SAM-dependent methyltransferase [Candidatus Siliceabacter maunaloa]